MSKTTHTPGPWLYAHRKHEGGEWYNTEVFTEDGNSGNGVVATLAWYPKPADADGTIGTYRESNARLIAAAPDLLEACKRAADLADRIDPDECHMTACAIYDLLHAAIAKAEGE